MYSEGVPAVQAVLRGKLTSRGGTERDWTRGTTLSHRRYRLHRRRLLAVPPVPPVPPEKPQNLVTLIT
jgi:hypothetical protein